MNQKALLYLQHPDETPKLIGVSPYLIHPPSKLSATASWIRFRDKTVLPMIEHRPHDPNLRNFLVQIEAILAWRARHSTWAPLLEGRSSLSLTNKLKSQHSELAIMARC